jgi:hypothetical protein
MTVTHDAHPAGLDAALLRDLVPRVVRSTAELVTWHCSRLDYGGSNLASGGLYRVGGTAQDTGETVSWSLILKIVCSPASLDEDTRRRPLAPSDDVGHWNYWQREVLAYHSGLLDSLEGGVVAPRCYGVTEQPGGTVWLWLEDIVEAYATPWPLERYGLAARHLGAWQGTYLAGRSLPDAPWLARGWLRSWGANARAMRALAADVAAWQQPRAQQAFGRPLYAAYQRLAAEAEAWLEVLDSVPQTLCHYDFLRPNLFARRVDGQEETVAIDWAYVGHGPVGADAGTLVFGTLLRPELPATHAGDLDRTVFASYLAGLRTSGWQGDPDLVRMSYGMAAALHGGLGVPLLVLMAVTDDGNHGWMEQQWQHPISQLVPQWGALARYLFDLTDEARGLLASHSGSLR